IELFENICQRERCPFAILGEATEEKAIKLHDNTFKNAPIDLPSSLLFGKPPKILKNVESVNKTQPAIKLDDINILEAAKRVLSLPTVADKTFLITIGDRTVTGLVHRDQMVGPWQIPVADVAVTCSGFHDYCGEAMAMGERTPVALLNPAASGRLAVGEAILNIAASNIKQLNNIKLSANWMAAVGHPGEDVALYETVKALGMELCPELEIAIPVGKDSMSMKTVWQHQDEQRSVTAPLSLIITAFSPITDVRKTLTPQLKTDIGETTLILIDLGSAKNRLGASALAQVTNQIGDTTADLDNADLLKFCFRAIQQLNQKNLIKAYHDRSDGGLFVTLCEMAFAGHCGIDIELESTCTQPLNGLFAEELGCVIQIQQTDRNDVLNILKANNLEANSHIIGQLNDDDQITLNYKNKTILSTSRTELQQTWSSTSHQMQCLRDNADCVKQEYQNISLDNPGIQCHVTFDTAENITAPYINLESKPDIAVLREQGVNGQLEMAAAFDRAGFNCFDVHMSDLLSGRYSLDKFKGIVACGGFSYGDVLGAGQGWAKTILYNETLKSMFERFFQRSDSFGLGVCNGCQMMSQLQTLIPGTEQWPTFARNRSEQFEARFSLVEIQPSNSIFFKDMAGCRIPIAVAHGEGRVMTGNQPLNPANITLRYIDHTGNATERYPYNPNGSADGVTGLTNQDGRFTIMMPHPERVFRTVQHSWHPEDWNEDAPWLRFFRNARVWVD
ncbi:MAG: phosphoribosylformylglycinamidine synthase, partial [Methylococcales bacterium]|nr:phosphoribosylformylglycinamidine synthase [Methylococcales bacterium]